jgi:hypothetical protein
MMMKIAIAPANHSDLTLIIQVSFYFSPVGASPWMAKPNADIPATTLPALPIIQN